MPFYTNLSCWFFFVARPTSRISDCLKGVFSVLVQNRRKVESMFCIVCMIDRVKVKIGLRKSEFHLHSWTAIAEDPIHVQLFAYRNCIRNPFLFIRWVLYSILSSDLCTECVMQFFFISSEGGSVEEYDWLSIGWLYFYELPTFYLPWRGFGFGFGIAKAEGMRKHVSNIRL